MWIKASDKMPEEDGEYLVVVEREDTEVRFLEICYYNNDCSLFSCYDYYNDTEISYGQKDILYWMKVPDYKNLEK